MLIIDRIIVWLDVKRFLIAEAREGSMTKNYKILKSQSFDVLMPMYNAETYIDQAIASVLNSSHKQFRLICLDDASVDATYERLLFWKEKDDRLLPFRHETSLGFKESIKWLLSIVSSQYFFFMRPEDVLSPYFLALIEQTFEKRQADIVYHAPLFCSERDHAETNAVKFTNSDKIGVAPEEKSSFFKDPSLWNRVYRSKFFFDEFSFHETETFDFNPRLLNYYTVLSADKIVEIPDRIYSYDYEKRSIFDDMAVLSTDFSNQFLAESDAIRVQFEQRNCWSDYRDAFFIGELFELIRQYENLKFFSTQQDYHQVRLEESLKSFAEIGVKLGEDQKKFYSSAVLSKLENNFIQDILGIRLNKRKHCSEESIPMIPYNGKIKLSVPNHEVYYDCDLFTVLSWNVGGGYLAIDSLGYGTPLALPEHLRDSNQKILSAHCPSRVRIHIKKRACLRGVLNGTAKFSPHFGSLFYVDDQFLGRTIGPKDETQPIILEPGFYDLRIESFDPRQLHSLWIMSECFDSVYIPKKNEKSATNGLRSLRYGNENEKEWYWSYYPIGILSDLKSPDIGTALYNYALQIDTREKGLREFIRLGCDQENNENDADLPEHARTILKCHDEFQENHFDFSSLCKTKQDFLKLVEKYKQLYVYCDPQWFSRIKGGDSLFSLENVPENLITCSHFRLGGEYLKNNLDERTRKAFDNFGSIIVLGNETADSLFRYGIEKTDTAIDLLFMPLKEDWIALADYRAVPDKPYIFVYLTDELKEIESIFETIKKSSSLEIVFFPSFGLSEQFVTECSFRADHVITGGPKEFLALIKNADFVLTDDYHAVVFSIIFEKPFHVLGSRNKKSSEPDIRTLLKNFHLERRYERFENNFETIELNFSCIDVNDRIQRQRKQRMNLINRNREKSYCIFKSGEPSIVAEKSEQPESKLQRIDNERSIKWNSFEYPNPDFTICVPVYNAVSFIDDTVKSVLRSTHENFKLVLTDNCSTDGTIEKLKYWSRQDSRIIVLLNDRNIGVSGNVLRCIPYINTPYVAWLDADDMFSPYYMELCKRELKQHDADAVFFQTIYIDPQGKYLEGGTKHGCRPTWYQDPSEKAFLFCRPASCDKIWDHRTSSLAYYYEFKPTVSNARAHMDIASNLQALSQCRKIISIPNALYYRRIHPGSITERKNDEIQLDAVEVFDIVKKDYLRWGIWDEYKELFYRFKLNHLSWLYMRLPESLQIRLISKFLAAMDREERWFFRKVRLNKYQRVFVDKILGLRDFKTVADNYYPDSKPMPSSFSYPFIDAKNQKNKSVGTYFENDFFAVHTWTVGRGHLGINERGYENSLCLPDEIKLISYTILNAHCPSKIKVSFKRPVEICGFMNGTSSWSVNSNCHFRISGRSLGCLFGPGDITERIVLPSGTYELETSGTDFHMKYSAWAIREANESRLEKGPQFQKPHLAPVKNNKLCTK